MGFEPQQSESQDHLLTIMIYFWPEGVPTQSPQSSEGGFFFIELHQFVLNKLCIYNKIMSVINYPFWKVLF